MALVRPFCSLRPVPERAAAVASVPYDVVSRTEARDLAAGNPLSFLHVTRAEIDLDAETDAYAEAVYRAAADNLARLRTEVPLVVEDEASLYFYRLTDGSHEQTGLAGCFSLDEYDRGVIKRHERTRVNKEDDRTRHMLALGAQTGIVCLAYRVAPDVSAVKDRVCCQLPLIDIAAPDGVRHALWRLDTNDQRSVIDAFERVPCLYIADGHHRIASAARARDALAAANTNHPTAEARYVLGVAFPDLETRILPYNRAVATLAGLTPEAFCASVATRLPVRQTTSSVPGKGEVAMYLDGSWYALDLRPAVSAAGGGVAEGLDVAVLQDQVLAPVLRVTDVSTDPRMIFVGGSRGTAALEELVNSGEAAVAFSMAAVTTEELLRVSDAGEMMPPKSTWFEPKLRDGLLIHEI